MAKEFVVYFNNRKFVFTQSIEKCFEGSDDGFFFKNPTLQDFSKILEIFQTHPVIQNVFVGNTNVEKLFERFSANFKVLDAAGGVVQNEQGDYLLIFRRHKWDLPKGKVEVGEGLEAAALREVQEETGVAELFVKKHLATTYHIYEQDGETILKRTYWYVMSCSSSQSLIPQTIEDITRVEWVNPGSLPLYLSNTYGNIQCVISEAVKG